MVGSPSLPSHCVCLPPLTTIDYLISQDPLDTPLHNDPTISTKGPAGQNLGEVDGGKAVGEERNLLRWAVLPWQTSPSSGRFGCGTGRGRWQGSQVRKAPPSSIKGPQKEGESVP